MKKFLLIILSVFVCVSSMALASCGSSSKLELHYNDDTNKVETVKATKGEEFEFPTPEDRIGYEFVGWCESEDCSGEALKSVIAPKKASYYAKWTKLYLLELDLGGGSMAGETKYYMKSGALLSSVINNLAPQKAGCQFGGWFVGDSQVSSDAKMTESGVKLTAKYKVEYTIEVYTQNLQLNGYEKTEEVKGYELPGKTYKPDHKVEGFDVVSKSDSISEKVISETPSENKFKLYYDRKKTTVVFNPNYPNGKDGEIVSETFYYGVEYDLPADLTVEGYCLGGWSETKNASVAEYKVDSLSKLVYNDSSYAVSDKYVGGSENKVLYATWLKAYTDMFNGDDYIYLVDEVNESGKNVRSIYLCRGEMYFKGNFISSSNGFVFKNSAGQIFLEGKLYTNHKFVYSDANRAGYEASLYTPGSGLNIDEYILFDEYDGVTYYSKNMYGITVPSDGSYVINDDGTYTAKFTSGKYDGKTLNFQIGKVNDGGVEYNAFQIRKDEDIALGDLVYFVVSNNSITYYINDYLVVYLNGYDMATMKYPSNTFTYVIKENNGVKYITFRDSNGDVQFVGRIEKNENLGVIGYYVYVDALDHTFTCQDGGTLTLDGCYSAKYTNGEDTCEGYYTVKESAFGGFIISLYDSENKVNRTFLTNEIIPEEDGQETQYVFESKPEGYAEYYYRGTNGSTYYGPLLVINDNEAPATIYAYTQDRTYVKIATGTITGESEFEFTITETFEVENDISYVDITNYKSFTYLCEEGSSYNAVYWLTATDKSDNTVGYVAKFDGANNSILVLVSGYAVYTTNSTSKSGTYSVSGNIVYFSDREGTYYFLVDDTEYTFITLKRLPSSFVLEDKFKEINEDITLVLDGNDNAVYTYVEGGETKTVNGKVSETVETAGGAIVYDFVSDDNLITFKYIEGKSGLTNYFTICEAVIYTGANGELLSLDGYCEGITYADEEGNITKGEYYAYDEENVILAVFGNEVLWFDITGNTFVMRGIEYGSYLYVDNQATDGTCYDFDGYGNLKVYTMDGDIVNYIDDEGTYTIKDGEFTLVYVDNGNPVSRIGAIGEYSYGLDYGTFVLSHRETMRTYIVDLPSNVKKDPLNDRWSIIFLGDFGRATKYSGKGVKETGGYTLITDSLFYYFNDSGTIGSLYSYDSTNGTAVRVSTLEGKDYYTSELESLLFTQYGFAIFGGQEEYFYSVDEDGNITLYYQDKNSPEASKYGFVEDKQFGKFDSPKVYNGKTYYMTDGGLRLTRSEDKLTEEETQFYPYPIKNTTSILSLETLVFTPNGTQEFNVSGQVNIGGTNYYCRVVREYDYETSQSTMYLLTSLIKGTYYSNYYYRFDIEVCYGAEDSYYNITGMTFSQGFVAYPYAYLYNYIYSFYGSQYANQFVNAYGTMYLNHTFDANGELSKDGDDNVISYFSAEFGESSGMYDLNGNLISFENLEYEYNEETNFYSLVYNGEDGYTYNLTFEIGTYQSGQYVYAISEFVRIETVETEEYTLVVEKLIASDVGRYPIGAALRADITRKSDSEEIEVDLFLISTSTLYAIVRERDEDGKITSTNYISMTFTDTIDSEMGDDKANIVPTYASVVIDVVVYTTYMSEDLQNYVDIDPDNKVKIFFIGDVGYAPSESSYDENTKTYTVKTSGGSFTITIGEDGNITIEEVEEQA